MEKLRQTPLPYSETALEPVKSKETLVYHYDHLYKGYVDRYNKGEGDPKFNKAGAFLHDIYFTQFIHPGKGGEPGPLTLELIERKHIDLEDLKSEMLDTAMKIQGSGWVYLSTDGSIKTIKNHEIRDDIAILIDWWEHAYALDYEWDKPGYFKNLWRIMNWPHIEDRVALMT